MSNPSTIWAQLAMPNPPAGSIPFVFTDGATIVTDVLNFFYIPSELVLNIANGLQLDFVTKVSAPAVNYTINRAFGRIVIPAGQTVITINNNLANVGDLVICTIESAFDATLQRLNALVTSNGSMAIGGNAAATAAVTVAWMLVQGTAVVA